MKKLTTSALLLAAILLTSCGGSDDNSGGNGNGGGSTPVTPIAGKFTKNVLIEDFTGTWCGYCPRVAYGIEKVLEQNITAVPVAIHRGNDPYNFAEGSILESQINLTGYPTAMINRTLEWAYPEPNNTIQVKNQTGPNADLGIAMNSTVANGTINLDVKVKFDANMTGLKLVVYALENNLIYNQTNYTSYYGGVSTIQNGVSNLSISAGGTLSLTASGGVTVPAPSASNHAATKAYVDSRSIASFSEGSADATLSLTSSINNSVVRVQLGSSKISLQDDDMPSGGSVFIKNTQGGSVAVDAGAVSIDGSAVKCITLPSQGSIQLHKVSTGTVEILASHGGVTVDATPCQ
jgi:hypothetical protein